MNCFTFYFGKQQTKFPRLTLLKVLLQGKQSPSKNTFFTVFSTKDYRKANS